MKLNGSHKFTVSSRHVFNALLNPGILQSCIPGCQSVEYVAADNIRANISTPLPGFKGPYGAVIHIAQRQEPSILVLEVQKRGTGGSINAFSHIHIADEPDGALLTYNATADLDGPVALANNAVGQGVVKNSLGAFLKNLDKSLV